MKDPKVTVRYLGFQALSDGSRRFDFSFSRSDSYLQLISVRAPYLLFSGPNHVAIQECAGICYETLTWRVVGCCGIVSVSISLTPGEIAHHRKLRKTAVRRPHAWVSASPLRN